jgi:hypothetical protein
VKTGKYYKTGKMKRLFTIPVLLFAFLSISTAQDQIKIPAGISLAFKAGNSSALAEYFNSTVEILLLDKEDFYSKNVAENILGDFFSKYHTREFTIRHQGAKNDAQYAIANLTTDKGNFRVYFLLKKVNSMPLIHQIRIEPDDEH